MSEREIFRSFLFMEVLMKLVIAEKPSVVVIIAKVIGARARKKVIVFIYLVVIRLPIY